MILASSKVNFSVFESSYYQSNHSKAEASLKCLAQEHN